MSRYHYTQMTLTDWLVTLFVVPGIVLVMVLGALIGPFLPRRP